MSSISLEKKIELIQSLIKDFEALPHRDEAKLDASRRRTKMIITNLFSNSSCHLEDFNRISFHPYMLPSDEDYKNEMWVSGKQKMLNLLATILEELKLLTLQNVPNAPVVSAKKRYSNRVFIVHGHDEASKERLAHFLREFGLGPIVLHDQPNQGRTLIEKFEEEATDIGYAFIIMTPDDVSIEKQLFEEIQNGKRAWAFCNRSRQNVILELGFFYGKLGRDRVCCLVKGDVEKPSDFSGIVYLPFNDKMDEVYRQLIKELRAADYTISI